MYTAAFEAQSRSYLINVAPECEPTTRRSDEMIERRIGEKRRRDERDLLAEFACYLEKDC